MPDDGCAAEEDRQLRRACSKAWAQKIPMPHARCRDIIVVAAFDTSKMELGRAMQNGPGEARGRFVFVDAFRGALSLYSCALRRLGSGGGA